MRTPTPGTVAGLLTRVSNVPPAAALLCGVIASGLALSGPLAAQNTTQRLQPTISVGVASGWTTISGDAGLSSHTLEVGGNWVLTNISFAERSDRPCFVSASFHSHRWFEPQAGGTEKTVVSGVWDLASESLQVTECGGPYGSGSRKWVGVAGDEAPRAIHGLSVCQRRSNDRLKGMSVVGSDIQTSGPRRNGGLNSSQERPNCNDWNPRVTCPSGEVAIGLKVEFRGESAVGLSLRCAPTVLAVAR